MKEWYLIGNKTKPNVLGGYENQSFLDYKEDAFAEALETDVATTVLLCNSDLSIQNEIRCILEGNVADTQLQSMQRKGLFTRGNVKDGMYVFFEGGYWLIIGFPGTNGIYEKATMSLCQFKLRWQNSDGQIIERWAYTEDFTKYSNGLTGNNTLTIGDNQYGLTLPIDSETKKLKRDMRFPIDFDDCEQPDVYKLTNRKVKLNDNNSSGHGGTMIVTMSFDAFNPNDDKKVTMENGQEVWICNYNNSHTPLPLTPQPPDETTDLRCVISGNKNLKNGYTRTYTALLFDKNDTAINWDDTLYYWNVQSDFPVQQIIDGNKIKVKINDENLIGSSFTLQVRLKADDSIIAEDVILIIELIIKGG